MTHAAQRVAAGELPHLNYNSLYSGALSELDALSFKLFGNRFGALQQQLLAFSVVFVLAMYCIARHVAGPISAAFITLLCVVWSLPNYFIGMPSWYNLFFAGFGTLLLLRHIEDGRRRWLLLAGLCAGCSIIIKVIGLYFVAAVWLYFVYREQNEQGSLEPAAAAPRRARLRRSSQYEVPAVADIWSAAFILASLIMFIGCIAMLISYGPKLSEISHFALPAIALTILLVVREIRLAGRTAAQRLKQIVVAAGVFMAGVAIPVTLFALPYARRSGLDDLWFGLLSASTRLAEPSAIVPLPASSVWFVVVPVLAIGLILFVARDLVHHRLFRRAFTISMGSAAVVLIVGLGWSGPVYRSTWQAARALAPLVTIGVVVLLASARWGKHLTRTQREQTFLLCAVAAMVSLVQVPFAHAIYFLYAAPLVFLAAAFYFSRLPGVPRPLLRIVATSFGLFAVLWLNGGYSTFYGQRYRAHQPRPLQIERCRSLLVDPVSAEHYEAVVQKIQEHSKPGSYIYAGPDCPEIYFFADRKNPTRTLYDFLDPDFRSPGREHRILRQLEEHDVDVVVLNYHAPVSGPVSESLEAELLQRYPHGMVYLKPQSTDAWTAVLWKESEEQSLVRLSDGR
ncbi:MAG TPA: glycosyltransferase family 39 protein [Pirellulales bacterium]|nr:glycosyltransferase family 39 protein [Pirellulales bacterium]